MVAGAGGIFVFCSLTFQKKKKKKKRSDVADLCLLFCLVLFRFWNVLFVSSVVFFCYRIKGEEKDCCVVGGNAMAMAVGKLIKLRSNFHFTFHFFFLSIYFFFFWLLILFLFHSAKRIGMADATCKLQDGSRQMQLSFCFNIYFQQVIIHSCIDNKSRK